MHIHVYGLCILCVLRIILPVVLLILLGELLKKFDVRKGDSKWIEKESSGFRTE